MHVCVQYFTVAIARRLHGHVDIANVQEVRTGLFNKRFPHVRSASSRTSSREWFLAAETARACRHVGAPPKERRGYGAHAAGSKAHQTFRQVVNGRIGVGVLICVGRLAGMDPDFVFGVQARACTAFMLCAARNFRNNCFGSFL
jgi:hypothetical protein